MDLNNLKIIKKDFGMDFESIIVLPLGDLHIGSFFDEVLFDKFVKWVLSQPNIFVVITGDVIEMVTKNSKGGIYEVLRPKQQKEIAIKVLRPLAEAGRIIAYVDGNHEHRVSKDTDEFVGEYICTMLGIPSVYDPDGVYMFLSCGYDSSAGKSNRLIYSGYIMHGYGGGRRIGAKFNNNEDLAKIAFADFYITGHGHEQGVFPKGYAIPDYNKKKLQFRKRQHVMAGSFLQWGGYSQRGGFSLSVLGSPYLVLNGRERDIKVVS